MKENSLVKPVTKCSHSPALPTRHHMEVRVNLPTVEVCPLRLPRQAVAISTLASGVRTSKTWAIIKKANLLSRTTHTRKSNLHQARKHMCPAETKKRKRTQSNPRRKLKWARVTIAILAQSTPMIQMKRRRKSADKPKRQSWRLPPLNQRRLSLPHQLLPNSHHSSNNQYKL